MVSRVKSIRTDASSLSDVRGMEVALVVVVDLILVLTSSLFCVGVTYLHGRRYDPSGTHNGRPLLCADTDHPPLPVARVNITLGPSNSTVVQDYTIDPFCGIGRFRDGAVCRLAYTRYDSYNPLFVDSSVQWDVDLRMHSCGVRLQNTEAQGGLYVQIADDVDLQRTISEMVSSSMSYELHTNVLQQVTAMCAHEEAVGPSYSRDIAIGAYDILRTIVPTVHTTHDAVRAMAILSSMGCSSVVRVGVAISGDGFVAVVVKGDIPSASEIESTLRLLQKPVRTLQLRHAIVSLQTDSQQANDLLTQLANFVSYQTVRLRQTGVTPQYIDIGLIRYTNDINSLAPLNSMLAHTSPADYDALVDGLCAMCVLSVSSSEHHHTWDTGIYNRRSFRSRRTNRVGAMHRSRSPHQESLSSVPTNADMLHASIPSVYSAMPRTSESTCESAVRYFYPDAYDALILQTTTSGTLRQRVHSLFVQLKLEMQHVLSYPVFHELLQNNANAIATTQYAVAAATLQLVGEFAVESTDGFHSNSILTLLDEASRATARRLRHVGNRASPCEYAPLYEGVATNAYMLVPFGCVVVGAGLLLRPFADASYSDTALLTGVGVILAHEIAHSLSVVRPPFREVDAVDPLSEARLLASYAPDARDEALADLMGLLAVLRLHDANHACERAYIVTHGFETCNSVIQDMCTRVGQVWCTRYETPPVWEATHPPASSRWHLGCRNVASLLRDGFPNVG